MRNQKFSQVSRNDIKEKRSEEKAVGKCLPQSSSYRYYVANEPLEEEPEEEPSEVEEDPEEEPSEVEEDPEEEPSEVEEDPEEESSEEVGNKLEKEPSDDLEEDPIEELEEEASEVLLEQIEEPSECDAQSFFNRNNNGSEELVEDPPEASLSECHSGTDPNSSYKKKRSLDASTGESVSLQRYQSQKKYRQEESLKPESESWYAASHLHGHSGLAMTLDDKGSSEQQEGTGSSGKRRRSRWDKAETDQASKGKKTKWIGDDSQLKQIGPLQLPYLRKELVAGSELESEIQELKAELVDISRKLQTSELHDDRPMEERSPSPEPVYDYFGIRINTRQERLRQKLLQKRQHIISKLFQKNPTLQQPLECKSLKLFKKLYVPVKEYPTYNFIGLIIGPLGNTQKRMEKETGAKIRLRGKDITTDPQKNDEDLHVYIEANNQKSLDAAVGMIEKLLKPIDEGMNEHKRGQLEELATLKTNVCRVCHDHGHQYFACPQWKSTFKMVCCDKCGSYNHPTETCGAIAMSPLSNSGQGSGSTLGSTTKTQDKTNKEIDETNLYVCFLPENVDDNRLMELFSPFGKITKVRVMRNLTTGISKGFGFVKFENQSDAAAAMAHFNGYRMDGHMLSVKIAGMYEKVKNPIDVRCDKCGRNNHPTETCRVIAMSPQSNSGQGSVSSLGSTTKTQDRPSKEIDKSNLYVCYLPANVDDNRLMELFSAFGKINKGRVMRNQTTGISKGFGFVKFENQSDAAAAMAHFNGYRIDGHMLSVKIAGMYEKVQNPIDVHCDKGGSYNHPTETCQVITMSPQSSSGQGSVSSLGSTTKAQDRPNKVIDNTNLYVCYLPENVDDNRLIELFSLFAAAIAHLNGYRMDGHALAVRIAGAAPESLLPSHLSPYRGPPPVFPNVTGQIASLGWTPGSMLSMPLTPFPISHGINFLSSSIYEEHGNVLRSEGLDFAPPPGLSSLSDLTGCSSLHSSSNSSNQIQSTSGGLIAQFAGNPDYPSSGFETYFMTPTTTIPATSTPMPATETHCSQTPESNLKIIPSPKTISQAFTWCIGCDGLCLIFNLAYDI
ncbi:hypothetical protein CMV_014179 [Castanea mollissima]|uniref:RRM domain-containing protein n=1 Tax=Castanea mollissima TaxID=60419 RepID=A0A8J4QWJ5_9ROSI|nr:hypothetical protein CMV_014179 [Castanea mollissima]